MLQKGKAYEDLAASFLAAKNLDVLFRNFRCKLGEIDLICRDQETLVFVEVRFRGHDHFGSAAASVTRRKQQKIIRTARYFLQRHNEWATAPCRFDVLAIEPGATANTKDHVQWLANAFTA